jgi:hypothetical protein
MFITIHSKKWFDLTGWSIGYRPSCDRTEAIRIGRVISTTSLYVVVPVNRSPHGRHPHLQQSGPNHDRV